METKTLFVVNPSEKMNRIRQGNKPHLMSASVATNQIQANTSPFGTTDEHVRPVLPESATWTKRDGFFAAMFRDWDNLPVEARNEHVVLRELDSVITSFEAHIDHSDQGFRKWRSRHQTAMRYGAADIPGWPRLQTQNTQAGSCWNDEAWEKRYTQLVLLRHDLTLRRLRKLPQRRNRILARFFGHGRDGARQTMRMRRPKLFRGLGELWWKPLDALLEDLAWRWGVDVGQLKRDFWRPRQGEARSSKLEVTVKDDGR